MNFLLFQYIIHQNLKKCILFAKSDEKNTIFFGIITKNDYFKGDGLFMKEIDICDWKMNFDGYDECKAKVPCSMYSVLLDNKLIPDPFYRDNELQLTELSEKDCDFISEFSVDSECLEREHITLCFEGIDTLADVTLNGKFLGHTENMHRVWEYDVKSILRRNNKLEVHFYSPLKEMKKRQQEHYLEGDPNSSFGIAHLRKALCMSGWDWAPTLPDMGFYRPVRIKMWDGARISDFEIRQKHETGMVTIEAKLLLSENSRGKAIMVVETPDGKITKCDFVESRARICIENPFLWWPRGLGEQPLYTVRAVVYDEKGDVADFSEKKIGIRTLTVCRDKDEFGEQFCFVANGIKFFAMGANYVPEDSILARLSKERTEKLIRMICDANFNCIRVWGGAFYPNEWFYELCDKYGIVVWQDFMFACINVHMTEEFSENVKAETIENLKRIRHHACIGLLCGNNEMELMLDGGFGCKHDGIDDTELLKKDYLELYENMLPKISAEYAPDIFYWPASPSSGGNFDNPNDEKRGDVHYWGAWHGSIPFEAYRKYRFRFCSEFGFESMPNIKTVRSFSKKSDMNVFSWVMDKHQKSKPGNGKMLTYLSGKYLYPGNFEHLIYATELLQADAIRYGVEHFRRFRGICMGAIYWQLNDCWPAISWSSVDYYQRPKALHYFAKRFFAPIVISAHENGKHVVINVSSESVQCFSGKAIINLRNSKFGIISSKSVDVNLDALSTLDIDKTDYVEITKQNERRCYLEYSLCNRNGDIVSCGTLLFVPVRFFEFEKPDIAVLISGENGEFEFTVSAKNYAKAVNIDFAEADVYLDDNFFDIYSEKPLKIKAHIEDKNITAKRLKEQLIVQSVYDIPNL